MQFTSRLAAALLVLGSAAPALAQQASDDSSAMPQTIVAGFRHARFGMTEDDVRQAISVDFHVGRDQIKRIQDPVDRTTVLDVIVPDVLADGGKADVDYLFGYHSHELFSVSVTWSSKLDPTVTAKVLGSNADTLRHYFGNAGYKADTIKMNFLVAGLGLVLFQGSDVEGHLTRLAFGGDMTEDQQNHLHLQPTELTLQYIADPANPDTFRIAPGQF